jgi:hypothetical protein
MVIRKTMSNIEIYNTANALSELFNDMVTKEMKLPVKVNFYFQKNMNALIDMAQELEQEKNNIVLKYGTVDEEDPNRVNLSPEVLDIANKELADLFALEQEVAVNVIELDWFEGIDMTPQQLAAITFMINDEE